MGEPHIVYTSAASTMLDKSDYDPGPAPEWFEPSADTFQKHVRGRPEAVITEVRRRLSQGIAKARFRLYDSRDDIDFPGRIWNKDGWLKTLEIGWARIKLRESEPPIDGWVFIEIGALSGIQEDGTVPRQEGRGKQPHKLKPWCMALLKEMPAIEWFDESDSARRLHDRATARFGKAEAPSESAIRKYVREAKGKPRKY